MKETTEEQLERIMGMIAYLQKRDELLEILEENGLKELNIYKDAVRQVLH